MNVGTTPLAISLRILARAPEAWIGGAIAAAAAVILAAAGRDTATAWGFVLAASIAAGALAQAAAGAVATRAAPSGFAASGWLARVCWPVAGAFLAICAGPSLGAAGPGIGAPGPGIGDVGPGIAVAAAIATAAGLTAALATACAGRGIAVADATTAALVVAAVAAAAAAIVPAGGPAVTVAIIAWLAGAGGVWCLAAPAGVAAAHLPQREDRAGTGAHVMMQGRVRTTLSTAAMLSSLAGMVHWFFLDPAGGARYPLLAIGWFVCLAVPQATSLAGCGAAGMLARSAAGADAAWLGPVARRACRVAATHALVLGWPAVVALAAVGGGALVRGGQLAVWPAVAITGLTIAAGALTALGAIAIRFSLRPDFVRAVACAIAAAAGLVTFAMSA